MFCDRLVCEAGWIQLRHGILGQETIYSTHTHLAFGRVTVPFTFI